jgi:flagellar protein FliS
MPALAHYKSVQAATASPERLTVMVLEAGLRHIKAASSSLRSGAFGPAHDAIEKATEIVAALDGTLKTEAAPELCAQLQAIYRFVIGRLAQAAASREPAYLEEAARAFEPIVEGFSQGAAALSGAPPAPQVGRP